MKDNNVYIYILKDNISTYFWHKPLPANVMPG